MDSASIQREAHSGIEAGPAPGPLSGRFPGLLPAEVLPPPRGKPLTAVFFSFSRPLFPPGPLRGFSAPARRGDRFFELKSRQTLLSNK